ncbi:MAG: DUF3316 domain-containing protein, partial [Muribaculaceae bacterium]|nr:DUF3316 domain-containing protein [Muribaculaceae bacterium]
MKIIKGIISVMLLLAASSAAAEADTVLTTVVRPVTSSYTIGIGSAHQANTYLTPLKYEGIASSLNYERWQAMKFSPKQWVMRMAFMLNVDKTQNPARNATMWYVGIQASWSMMHRWNLNEALTLGAGPATSLELGCLYNRRNGNNPAQANASWMIGGEAYATYKLNIRSLPVTLGYHASVPLTGAFFTPQYGELYYEIYLGDHSGLAHWGWWGNYFAIHNQFTADLHFGATAMRLGFQLDYTTTAANHITTRSTRYMF